MFNHQFRSQRPSYPNQEYLVNTHNTTIVPSSHKRIDIIDINGRGVSPLVITIAILVIIFLLVCIWNGYHLWKRRNSKSRNFTITSADSYTGAWESGADAGSLIRVLSGMDDSHLSKIVEDVELQAFDGAGRRV